MKNKVSTPASVRATLERISREAKEKVQLGIAAKRAKLKTGDPQSLLEQLKQKIYSPALKASSKGMAAELYDTLFDNLGESAAKIVESVKEKRSYPGAARDAEGLILYPDGCRFLHIAESRNGYMVIEQPPQLRTLLVEGVGQVCLPLPYTVCVIYFDKDVNPENKKNLFGYSGLCVGFRDKPLKSLSDRLQYTHLPNISGHSVCLGEWREPRTCATLSDLANKVLGRFWQSNFQYGYPRFTYKKREIHDWNEWVKIGRGNPLDILDATFHNGQTLTQIIGPDVSAAEVASISEAVSKSVMQVTSGVSTQMAADIIHDAAVLVLERVLSESALQPQ